MSNFDKLKRDELLEVVEFFNKDVVAADPEKPSKGELVAALASDKDGSDPVSWKDYQTIYVVAKEAGQIKSAEVLRMEEEQRKAEEEAEEQEREALANTVEPADDDTSEFDPVNDELSEVEFLKAEIARLKLELAGANVSSEEVSAPVFDPDTDEVLVKYERKNPTWEAVGYVFSTKHPFASVPAAVAEYLVRQQEGFRLALPSEVRDYYA